MLREDFSFDTEFERAFARQRENFFKSGTTARSGMFVRRLVNLRQLESRRREDPFDEDSDPSGSRNGSTEMRW